MKTLADLNKTLQEQQGSLEIIAQNTEKTSGALVDFLAAQEKNRFKDLEEKREMKKTLAERMAAGAQRGVEATKDATTSAFASLKNFVPGFATGLGASMLPGLLRRGLPSALGILFADEIAEYLVGPDGSAQLKKQIENAVTGGSIGLLFGKKFGVIGTAVGYLSGDEEFMSQFDRMTTNIYNLAEKLGLGKFFNADSMAAFAQGFTGKLTNGVGAIADLLEGDFKGFLEDIDDALVTLGTLALLISPKKTIRGGARTLRGMLRAFKNAGPIGKTIFAVAAAMGLDYVTGEDDEGFGVEDAAYTAAAGYGGYQAFKAIKGANRAAPTSAQVAEQVQSYRTTPRPHTNFGRIVERHGQQYVTDSRGRLHLRGTPQANMIETRGGTNKLPDYSKYPRFKFTKALRGAWPLSAFFAVLEGRRAMKIWNDESLDDDTRAMMLGSLIGANIGSATFAALGGALGTAVGGLPGLFIGSMLGGVGGYVSGEYAGQKLMQFMMGQFTPTEQDLENLYSKKYDSNALRMANARERQTKFMIERTGARVAYDEDDDLTGGNYVATTPVSKPPRSPSINPMINRDPGVSASPTVVTVGGSTNVQNTQPLHISPTMNAVASDFWASSNP